MIQEWNTEAAFLAFVKTYSKDQKGWYCLSFLRLSVLLDVFYNNLKIRKL